MDFLFHNILAEREETMSNNKRWNTKEEAQEYVSNSKNYGLTFCAACDFLGINPNERNHNLRQFQLAITADCFISWSTRDILDLIDVLRDEIYSAEYVDGYNCVDSDAISASAEQVLAAAKQELRERRSYERRQVYRRYRLHKAHQRAKNNQNSK